MSTHIVALLVAKLISEKGQRSEDNKLNGPNVYCYIIAYFIFAIPNTTNETSYMSLTHG